MDDASSSSLLPATIEPADLHASWARSRGFGLRPEDALSDALVSPADLRDRLEANARLLTFSRPVIENLFRQIDCPSSTLLLTDCDGLILSAIGDTGFLDRATRVALCPGAEWSEAAMGTNAIGTALTTRQAITIDGSQHYLSRNRFLTCIATPIFSPTGGIAGILDVSTDTRANLSHADALLRTTAECIEHRLIESLDDGFLALHFHARPDLLGSPLEGLVVFDEAGNLLASNRAARTLLHLHGEFPRGSYPESFTTQWRHLVDWAAFGPLTPFPLRTRHGQTCAARAGLIRPPASIRHPQGQPESGRPRAPQQPRPAPTPDTDPRVVQAGALLAAWQRGQAPGPLLLSGETGTGKRHLLHRHCQDHGLDARLVELDGCALAAGTRHRPELEDALRRAAGGLLYITDADCLPAEAQSHLLQAAHTTHHIVVTGRRPHGCEAAACGPTPALLTEQAVQRVALPPLRERADFAYLVYRLVREARAAAPIHVPPETIERLCRYPWPGNISELGSQLRLMLALAGDDSAELRPDDIPDELLETTGR
ncbi:sigma-54-dependent Fis family transcriptional regulator [Thauera linaloolentis]|uniref:Sigma-54 dependent transcriptional regulator n=1 Tax=Thauera linaloolentis (strain DSM 12138 / JCM 21573 / CCUG 41526 / CIP 105981 / IAM 15112 / NBRC 102519 / 47Lol) TaxID=1123367 RepID=N6YXT6_THAL4|nr:GAF domain-containing protein [Thauera linaloolentis]ENO87227.1 sigma-54 dependent transcriptional regulator [Thauera linaloolentis 47Lol = DSM 12138]MCM8567380.1 GAF domain-containing protein [Thauera linaloolentis]